MPERMQMILVFLCAIGSSLIGGVFYAFSTFVMKALHRLPSAQGLAAMQSINIAVINPIFLGAFLGVAILSIAAIVFSVLRWDRPGSGWVLAGALLYLLGTFLVTVICNVPLNDTLAKLSSADPAAADVWDAYVVRWTLWNHVRMIASLLAAAAMTIGLMK